jgi:hypothetical protein
MSVFGNIMSAIFGHGGQTQTAAPTVAQVPLLRSRRLPRQHRQPAAGVRRGSRADQVCCAEEGITRLAEIDRRFDGTP